MSVAFFPEQCKETSWTLVSNELGHEAVGSRAVEVAEVVDGESQVDVAHVLGGHDEDLVPHLQTVITKVRS